jgi:type IV pilus assembly protein PilA
MGGNRMKMNNKGFTLIELLIVVAIIAILAAIAIPQFAKYRVRGYNSAADSDLRNMKIAIEAFATDNQVYASTKSCTSGASTCSGGGPGAGTLLSGPLSYTVTVSSGGIMSSPTLLPSATVNMLFGLSNGVLAGITTNSTTGQEGSAYVAVTSNTSGDTIYASDSGLTSLMRAGKDGSGSPVPIASGQAGGTLPYVPSAATGGQGDLNSNFVAM